MGECFTAVSGAPFATLAEACGAVGIEVPSSVPEGRYVRTRERGGRRSERPGSVRMASGVSASGTFWRRYTCMNWRTGEKASCLEREPSPRTGQGEGSRRRKGRTASRGRETASRAAGFDAAKLARELVRAAEPADAAGGLLGSPHGYLVSHGLEHRAACMLEIGRGRAQDLIDSHAAAGEGQRLPARWSERLLLVPLSRGGEILSVEFIDESGEKRLLKGGTVSGAAWVRLQPCSAPPFIGIAEGAATALSVEELFHVPCAAAVSAGNLAAAARRLETDFPGSRFCFFADNDPEKHWGGSRKNRGRFEAVRAAAAISSPALLRSALAPGGVMLPSFAEEDRRLYRELRKSADAVPTDWNDVLLISRMKRGKAA